MNSHIVYNCIETPDGTKLFSQSVHDYVTHKDKNGDIYVNDGGCDYFRRSVNKEPAKDISVMSTDPHKDIREVFYWGTYGKSGKEPYRYKLLCDMTTNHIEAILITQIHIPPWRIKIFKDELVYREQESIPEPSGSFVGAIR